MTCEKPIHTVHLTRGFSMGIHQADTGPVAGRDGIESESDSRATICRWRVCFLGRLRRFLPSP